EENRRCSLLFPFPHSNELPCHVLGIGGGRQGNRTARRTFASSVCLGLLCRCRLDRCRGLRLSDWKSPAEKQIGANSCGAICASDLFGPSGLCTEHSDFSRFQIYGEL